MRIIFGILTLLSVFCASAAANYPAATIQTFATQTNGLVQPGALQSSSVGSGTWSLAQSNGTWRIVTGPNYAFPAPIAASNTTVTASGTKWLRVDHANTNDQENLRWEYSGPYGGTSSNAMMVVRCFVRFAETNTSGSTVNYDHISTYGSPWGIVQEHVYADGHSTIMAHSANQSGGSANGNEVNITKGAVYWMTHLTDERNGVARVRLYDASTFALAGESTGLIATNGFGRWWVDFQANYLGHTEGYTEFAGISIEYGPTVSDELILAAPSTNTSPVAVRIGNFNAITIRR